MEVLRHPNVVCLYEVVEMPSRLYLVLEYAGGGDLHNRICNEGKLSDNASKITFAQILSAIKYMVSDIETVLSSSFWFLFSHHSFFCLIVRLKTATKKLMCGKHCSQKN